MTGGAIGQLRHRMTLQEPLRTADEGGAFVTTWENITAHPAVFAAITPLPAIDRQAEEQRQAFNRYRIILRHRADVTPQMRLVKDGRAYYILTVQEADDRQQYLEIVAEVRSV